MELGGDLRYAWRQLRAQRGYAAVAVLTLALGVGANTLAFSLLRGSVLRGLPFPEGDRLVLVQTLRQAPGAAPESHRFTWQQFRWLAGQRTPFTRLALYNRPGVNISAGGEAERVDAEFVSDGYFELLGVAAGLGRYFGPEENATPGTHPVVVLGDALWRRRFGADPGVLGRVVRVNGIPLEVIGIMPRGFGGVSGVAEAWLPEMMAPAVTFVRQLVSPETFQTVIAQLAPGFTAEAAERAMSGLGEQLRRAVPNAESAEPVLDASGVDRLQLTLTVRPLADVGIDPARRRAVLQLFGVVWLVLAVTCVNLMALLLARSRSRSRELAVRAALGCGRGRLIRQLQVEVLLLAVAGCVLSVGLAQGALSLLRRIVPEVAPVPGNLYAAVSGFAVMRLDGSVLLFALAASVLCAAIAGLVPALRATRPEALDDLRSSGRTGESGLTLRRAGALPLLTIVEIALALALAAGAGLLLRSFERARAIAPGFDAANVITFRIDPVDPTFSVRDAPTKITPVLERVQRVPGVRSASVSMCTPYMSTCGRQWLSIAGRPIIGEPPTTGVHYVAADHFTTLGIPLLRGRVFTAADRAGAQRVAIISETTARQLFPEGDALGARLAVGDTAKRAYPDSLWEVVGIVGNVTYWPPERPARLDVYLPYTQFTYASTYIIARTAADPLALVPALRAAVYAANADLPIHDVRTMEQRAAAATSGRRFIAVVLLGFAAIGLLLAAAGVYGVLSWSVSRRTREMGIRMALGAAPLRVFRMVLREGLVLTAVGMMAGTLLALALGALLRASLFGVTPGDPLTLAATLAVVLTAALTATALPAWRATRVAPTEALSAE